MIRRCRHVSAKREALGLSVKELSEATKIPVAHVQAIEDERLADLPAGPYAAAYLRSIELHLGLPVGTPAPAPPRGARSASPRGPSSAGNKLARRLAVAAMFALLGAMSWQVWSQQSAPVVAVMGAGHALDQTVEITARVNTHVLVEVDNEVVVDRDVAGGERMEFSARDVIRVGLAAADAVRIEFNGRRVVPQGRQDQPRTLVFIDDVGGVR